MPKVAETLTKPVREGINRRLGITPETADAQTDLLSIKTEMARYYTTSLRLVQSPHSARPLAQGAAIFIAITVLALTFVPWQQNVAGSGKVTRYLPNDRPQNIESPISARIQKWYVIEGTAVKAGDTLALLQDIGSSFMDKDFVTKVKSQRDNNAEAQENAVRTARQRTLQAIQLEEAAEAAVENAKFEVSTATVRLNRIKDLSQEGLASVREVETAQLAVQKANADLIRSRTSLAAAQQNIVAVQNDEARAVNQAAAAISSADLTLANAEQRRAASVVLAPTDGVVNRIAQAGAGTTVKEGDLLASVVPEVKEMAVEIKVGSMDAAMLDAGRPARLQFSGFPALQFSGWANISIGTYGGTVAMIDATDNGKGEYRVLIVPDSSGKPWPSQAYLRQGTDVTGWVMLSDVSLGYELWRQMNGFPPLVPVKSSYTEKEQGKAAKKLK
ncbi:MAG: HlyD family efflux transporter periplasmic adaptor subunit [Rhizobacter sp.]|nr:HlyD family efflux transporter periplasmic adaptor subunit [Chlorobiales bacterium]